MKSNTTKYNNAVQRLKQQIAYCEENAKKAIEEFNDNHEAARHWNLLKSGFEISLEILEEEMA